MCGAAPQERLAARFGEKGQTCMHGYVHMYGVDRWPDHPRADPGAVVRVVPVEVKTNKKRPSDDDSLSTPMLEEQGEHVRISGVNGSWTCVPVSPLRGQCEGSCAKGRELAIASSRWLVATSPHLHPASPPPCPSQPEVSSSELPPETQVTG